MICLVCGNSYQPVQVACLSPTGSPCLLATICVGSLGSPTSPAEKPCHAASSHVRVDHAGPASQVTEELLFHGGVKQRRSVQLRRGVEGDGGVCEEIPVRV